MLLSQCCSKLCVTLTASTSAPWMRLAPSYGRRWGKGSRETGSCTTEDRIKGEIIRREGLSETGFGGTGYRGWGKEGGIRAWTLDGPAHCTASIPPTGGRRIYIQRQRMWRRIKMKVICRHQRKTTKKPFSGSDLVWPQTLRPLHLWGDFLRRRRLGM